MKFSDQVLEWAVWVRDHPFTAETPKEHEAAKAEFTLLCDMADDEAASTVERGPIASSMTGEHPTTIELVQDLAIQADVIHRERSTPTTRFERVLR